MSQIGAGALVGQRLGEYELLALLAVGGTAEIYLARIGGEAGFEKYVVVKSLLDHLADDAEFVKMFLDEARLGAQLAHSNIVQTLELGEHQGRYFMAMEYLAGMSLAQLARKTQERVPGGYMPVDLVLGLAAQACAGLHYAHRKGAADGTPLNLIHRDISPQNLVVSFDGVLKIVDFGIAKADVRDTHTRSGTIKGKFAYMSPEQCLAKPIDSRTDIFALGVICHELLTARRLFKRSTTFETYEAILKGDVPTPSSINPRLDATLDELVMKALAYDKEKRYESAEDFGQALLTVLHRRGTSISASDVASYYETHFERELDEHAGRMRQLITGERRRADDAVTWGAEDLADAGSGAARREPPTGTEEISAAELEGLREDDTLDRETLDRETLDPEQGDAAGGAAAQARRSEADSGATRVELNPLEKARLAHARPRTRPGPTSDLRTGSKARAASAAEGDVARDAKPEAGTETPRRQPPRRQSTEAIGTVPAPRPPPTPRANAQAGPAAGGDQSLQTIEVLTAAEAAGEARDAPPGEPKRTVLGMSPFKPATRPGEPSGAPSPPGSSPPPQQQRPQQPPSPPGPGAGMKAPVPPDTLPPMGSRPGQPGSHPGFPPRPGYDPSSSPGMRLPPPRPRRRDTPPWLVAVVFVVALGVGLGLTLLIGS
jgi:serine/threonine-protein kinase